MLSKRQGSDGIAFERAGLMFAVRVNWRKVSLYLLLVAMEMSWLLPWVMALGGGIAGFSPWETALVMAGVMLLALTTSYHLSRSSLNLFQQQVVIILSSLLTAFLLIRFGLYGRYPFSQMAWLEAIRASLSNAVEEFPPEVVLLFLVFYLWWRGTSLSHKSLSFHTVGFSFRLGVLMLLISTPLAFFASGFDARIPVVLFFFFGLLALAMARIEEVGLSSAVDWRYWVGVLTGASVLVLVAGSVLARVYSLRGFHTLFHWLSPISSFGGKLLFGLFVLIGRLLEPIFQWIIGLFKNLPSNVRTRPSIIPFGGGSRVGEGVTLPAFLQWVLKGLAVVLVLFLVWLAFTWVWGIRSQEEGEGITEERERLPRQVKIELREALKRIPRVKLPPRLKPLPADEVRAIYANLLRLAAERGVPRQPSHTPYEYLPLLKSAFPGFQEELAAITDAYVKVRYGNLAIPASQMEYVRLCWEKLSERGLREPEHKGA
ncbi:MAG: hypothetical protein DRI61_09150 [Chloroflexi bacterium]|nr:MAG: hypothetical protein DRI61_09150 [Chloroflexota bacterium]